MRVYHNPTGMAGLGGRKASPGKGAGVAGKAGLGGRKARPKGAGVAGMTGMGGGRPRASLPVGVLGGSGGET